MGSSEILLKEAMAGAKEISVEHEIIRLLDLDIRLSRYRTSGVKVFY